MMLCVYLTMLLYIIYYVGGVHHFYESITGLICTSNFMTLKAHNYAYEYDMGIQERLNMVSSMGCVIFTVLASSQREVMIH